MQRLPHKWQPFLFSPTSPCPNKTPRLYLSLFILYSLLFHWHNHPHPISQAMAQHTVIVHSQYKRHRCDTIHKNHLHNANNKHYLNKTPCHYPPCSFTTLNLAKTHQHPSITQSSNLQAPSGARHNSTGWSPVFQQPHPHRKALKGRDSH